MGLKIDSYVTELKTGIIVLDDSLCVRFLNSSAESLLDTSSKACLNKPLSNLFYEEPDNSKRFKGCLVKKENYLKLDALLLLRGDRKILCDYQLHPISNKEIKSGLILEINNKEYSSEIKERLRRQTNQQITNSFIRSLAHEIKNPLSGIRGAAQLLSKRLPQKYLHEYTNVIINQTDRLTALVDNMLGPNRKPSFKLRNIHIPIQNVFILIKPELEEEGIRITKDFDPSIPELLIDNYLLEQAILNLVRNAKESLLSFNTLSPKIDITTRILHQEFIGEIKHHTVCKISIEDNGPGIPEEIKESIFFPMISGKESGSGLGLSITQAIISQHKGAIEFHSSPGDTNFSILMPVDVMTNTSKSLKVANG